MSSLQVAIVDNDQGFAGAVSHFLADKGFEVNTYASGREAVNALAADEPLLAVIDANLPDMHGTEVISQLHSQCPDVPVLMVTGDTTPANIQRCRGCGIDGLMLKPLDPDHFYAVVQRLADRRR